MKSKLKLLEVTSFVTNMPNKEKNTINGANNFSVLSEVTSIVIESMLKDCIDDTIRIARSVIESNLNNNCTGATRPYNVCNFTSPPCRV